MKKKMISFLLLIIIIFELFLLSMEKRVIVMANNTDDMYSLITHRYSHDELEEYSRSIFLYKNNTVSALINNFVVECYRRVSDTEGYIVLLDEDDKPWFFLYKVGMYGEKDGNRKIYRVDYNPVFPSYDDIKEQLMYSTRNDYKDYFRQSPTNYITSVFLQDGLLVFNRIDYQSNQEVIVESLFIPNDKIRDPFFSNYYISYILEIDRIADSIS